MFSFKYAIICILAGLLAGWSFDKKNNIPILGLSTYIFVVNAFSLTFNYDQSWAFIAFIEMLAGHGLYKMGFGDFLGEMFFDTKDTQLANKQNKTKRNNNQSKHIEISDNNSEELPPNDVADEVVPLYPELIQKPRERCEKILSDKGYELIKTQYFSSFVVVKQNSVDILFKSQDIDKVLNWTLNAENININKNTKNVYKSSKEDEDFFENIRPDEFDDSY